MTVAGPAGSSYHGPMKFFLLLNLAFLTIAAMPAFAQESAVTTVDKVDLSRYTGLWYEIAKIPNRFQKQCASGTTAEYTLREDGRITVLNSCDKADGKRDSAKGEAKVIDTDTGARLQVSFVSFLGWRPFWGDYWIIGLDNDYQWSIVGTPDRKYGWVLARTPQLDAATMEKIFAIIEANGYSRDVFEMSSP
jgi:apolipoprotein D and lipocalin family protein